MNVKRLAALSLACLLLVACSKPAPSDPTPPPQPEQPNQAPQPEKKEKGSQPASGAFEKVQGKAGDPLPGDGLYFVDTASGAVEGWRPLPKLTNPSYQVSPDNRFVGVRTDESLYLIDRQSGAVSVVGGYLVAARGGHLLFNEPQEKYWASPRYFVLDGEQNLVARFELPKAGNTVTALISPDGARAMLATYTMQGTGAYLYLVDLASGQVELIADLESALKDQEVVSASLAPVPGTQELFFSLSTHARNSPGERGYQSLLMRLDWQGKILFEKAVPGRQAQVSPDGKHLLWQTDVAGYPGAVVMADMQAEPTFRAKVFTMGVHWLADGSGYLVSDRGTYRKVTVAGEAQPVDLCARIDCQAGLRPAPDRSDLFLVGQDRVVSLDGKTDLSLRIGNPMSRIAHRVEPFGESSRELRVVVEPARGGDGWDGFAWTLPLHIERPPFDDRLVVKGTGDCLSLREQPDRNAAVRACVPDGTPLTVAETTGRDRTSLLWGDGGQWVYVKTERGEQGWAAIWSGYVTWLH